MKRRVIEKIPVPDWSGKIPNGKTHVLTCRKYEDGVVIDSFWSMGHRGRYAINTETGEHETLRDGEWRKERFLCIVGRDPIYYSTYQAEKETKWATKEDRETFEEVFKNGMYDITSLEVDHGKNKRTKTLENRYRRYEELMERIQPIPEGLENWIRQRETTHYTFKEVKTGEYYCSNCKNVQTIKKAGPKNNDPYICPSCGAVTVVRTRKKQEWTVGRVAVMQPMDGEGQSVVRHFKYSIRHWLEDTGYGCIEAGETFYLKEEVRLIMHQDGGCSIFYDQNGNDWEWWHGIKRPSWSHQNPANKRMRECYLYPEGIAEALKGTSYESLTRAFMAMAAGRIQGKYNEAMCVAFYNRNLGNILELLYKNGFYNLLRDTMNRCDTWQGKYHGILNIYGRTEKEVFGLKDRQKIFRIRQNHGGERYLEWMRQSEEEGVKLSDKFMSWAVRNEVDPEAFKEFPNSIHDNMSYEKRMNYIEKQKPFMPPHWKGQTYSTIETWLDYLDMCAITGINTKDSLFYAPKDLKAAHDAMVVQKEKLQIMRSQRANKDAKEERARQVRERFPEAQSNLQAVAEKYEYTGEEYIMRIPRDLYEIVEEGQELHHCGGSSDRYFNRIENRETYIGFLRRVGEEDLPYYTIEFEPNGTIRQSRSYHDEEPEIELIRPFLREWQQVVKKRMTEDDRRDAQRSAELRGQNIKELQEKGNTFVLRKLEEDFMEAV